MLLVNKCSRVGWHHVDGGAVARKCCSMFSACACFEEKIFPYRGGRGASVIDRRMAPRPCAGGGRSLFRNRLNFICSGGELQVDHVASDNR